ncbi:glycosyltransferase-like protein, family 2 [Candidatus Magnetobacterium bavaricum]|uniref:Glycosyltransferase-like protein, family 2 n=1 Tax=Candidatus Magnetobacterium bavaricum TaxID=29290 RepID=A0A0F3GHG0_9BACT|nr:glycosyltransferase-like protein, family 2 [Candidatus Magnetobacterium bavaricum]
MQEIISGSKPLVSVIIPTYNHQAYIGEAIESALLQTYKEIEVIVMDNFSIDNTEAIVNSYIKKNQRIRYEKFDNKGIIGLSRNVGIKMAKGDYIAFLDSDDIWFSNKLEKVMNVFAKNKWVDLVCHDEYHVKGQSKDIIGKGIYGPYKTYEQLLFKGNALSTSAVVVRKNKLFEAGLFSEDLNFVTAEDYDLWLKLSKISRIVYLHEILGCWRVHDLSNSKNIDRHINNVLNVLYFHFSQWSNKNLSYRHLKRKRISNAVRVGGRLLMKDGYFDIAMPYLLKAISIYPLSTKSWVSLFACFFKLKL